jgi:hypothetical protein
MIRYALHAKTRMVERSISESQIEEALARPLEVVPTRYERRATCTQLDNGKYLIVVFEGAHEDFLVVTAMKVDRGRARRYGFTRV